ncbi:MAG: PQQ-binding-like beta-propeller repeat protein [bacterium]|nr:PQQ-binding-like beta-propeller repeat protein [bacterium]
MTETGFRLEPSMLRDICARLRRALSTCLIAALLAPVAAADESSPDPVASPARSADWPTYRRDAQRTGVSPDRIRPPLREAWMHRPMHTPRPAWPPPAREDVFHRVAGLSPTITYDRAYHVAVVDGRLYYGSSADDTVYRLNAKTGAVRWTYVTEGPVRLAPTVAKNRLYVGSDDGCVYCLDAKTGTLAWRQQIAPEDRRLPGNGRVISRWPVRSGVVVDDDTAYCTAGLFPNEGVHLVALDAITGAIAWRSPIETSSQGYMLASPSKLFLPTGRTAPASFDRANEGAALGGHGGAGGSFALVVDDMLVHGPGEDGRLHVEEPASKEAIVSTPGDAVLVDGDTTYLLGQGRLYCLDRARYLEVNREMRKLEAVKTAERTEEQKARLTELAKERKQCRRWDVPCPYRHSMVMARDVIYIGGDNCVAAYDTDTGEEIWTGAVDGGAYGLALAAKRLFVSTDTGAIHCFEHGRRQGRRRVASAFDSMTPSTDAKSLDPGVDALAGQVAAVSTSPSGYCLILDAGTGALAYEIVKRTRLHALCVTPDEATASAARDFLMSKGVYGVQASVHVVDGPSLPYPSYFANVIACEAALNPASVPAVPADEVFRVLRPCGGRMVLPANNKGPLRAWMQDAFGDLAPVASDDGDWLTLERGPLEGAGEWTHTYAEPGNTACSGDTRACAPLALQWFGPPGPARMVDRHFRNVPPLCKDGRIFIPGDEIVYAVDAYNGALLWQADVPTSRRVGVFLDASNLAVSDAFLYAVVGAKCHRFDVRTGAPQVPFEVLGVGPNMEWGYLAATDGVLVGSARAAKSGYRTITNDAQLDAQALWYPNMRLAVSTHVFRLDPATGEERWRYGDGRIVDTTLTVADGRLYFLESHSPKALADESGRLAMRDLIDGGVQYLVALNLADGAIVHRREIDVADFQQPTYLACTNGVLLLSGARIRGGDSVVKTGRAGRDQTSKDQSIYYSFHAFDAATLEPRWRAGHESGLSIDGGHGEYNRHPTIIGNTVYAWPFAYELDTGARVEEWKFDRHGHGCGGVSASANALFWRGGNPWMYDLRPGGGPYRITQVTRPGCWINIIPAGGLVLIPEASAGCTCGYALQTSLAFAPVEAAP